MIIAESRSSFRFSEGVWRSVQSFVETLCLSNRFKQTSKRLLRDCLSVVLLNDIVAWTTWFWGGKFWYNGDHRRKGLFRERSLFRTQNNFWRKASEANKNSSIFIFSRSFSEVLIGANNIMYFPRHMIGPAATHDWSIVHFSIYFTKSSRRKIVFTIIFHVKSLLFDTNDFRSFSTLHLLVSSSLLVIVFLNHTSLGDNAPSEPQPLALRAASAAVATTARGVRSLGDRGSEVGPAIGIRSVGVHVFYVAFYPPIFPYVSASHNF